MTSQGKRKKAGFTYFEIVGVVAILTVVMAISLVSIRSPGAKRQADSAGKVLLSALQAARAQAMAREIPVAVALAVEDQEAASGFYVLEGHLNPRVVAATDLASEFSGVYLTNATWSSPTTATVNPGENFLLEAWLPPREEDPTLIFLPSGKVVSNGLKLQDGHYTLVLGRGLNVTAGDTPTKKLSAVSDPYTIRVGEHGEMTLEKGLPGGEEFVVASASAPTVGTLPPLTPPSDSPPEVLKVSVFPEDTDEEVTYVPVGGTLSLVVEAWSPSGLPLFALWTGDGSFSSKEPIPMRWHPLEGVWKGNVEWAVPIGASPGDNPEFDVQVMTSTGQSTVAGDYGGQFKVAPSARKVIYSMEVPAAHPDPNSYYYTTQLRQVYDDGSGDKLLADSGGTNVAYSWFDYPDFSPDGSRYLVYLWQEDYDYSYYYESLKLGLTGSGPVQDFEPNGGGTGVYGARWSPDGTKISFNKNNRAWIVDADGNNEREVTPTKSTTYCWSSAWSPDGRYLFHNQYDYKKPYNSGRHWERYEFAVFDTKTGNSTLIDGFYTGSAAMLPGTERLVALGYDDSGRGGLYEMNLDGSSRVRLVDFGTSMNSWWTDLPVGISTDGRYISYQATAAGEPYGLRVYDKNSGTVHILKDVQPIWGQSQGQWSPDGEYWILAAKYYEGAEGSGNRLIRCRPDGSEMTWVSDFPNELGYGYVYSADWSK